MDVMLDLETMGNSSNAAIIAIGAVAFDMNGLHNEFYSEVNLQSSIASGGKVDGSTVMWWLQQNEQARSRFKNNDNAPTLVNALIQFDQFCKNVQVGGMWGNGAMFDNSILGNAYKSIGLEIPWKFYNDRCYRTIKNMKPNIKLNRIGVHHDAVDDAKSQALHLIELLR